MRHCVLSKWYLLFLRCDSPACTHCCSLGPTTIPFLKGLLAQQGGKFAFPTKKTDKSFYSFSELYARKLFNAKPDYLSMSVYLLYIEFVLFLNVRWKIRVL
jgi:hypothetical protein